MPQTIPDAGELRDKVRLLEFRPLEPGRCCCKENGPVETPAPTEEQAKPLTWEWAEYRKAWAKATPTSRMAIFATTGVGSHEVEFVIRRQRFCLGNAIEWKGRFCLPTSVEPLGPGHLLVKAALVRPLPCKGVDRDTGRAFSFPAVVTEKYMGHTQAEPMAQNAVSLVLVVPKTIRLKLGSLVELPDAPYWVKVPHELDPDKTEYEVERTVEP